MLTEKIFKQNIGLLSENFNFQPSTEWLKMVFAAVKEKTTDLIFQARVLAVIMHKKNSDWNKDFGFGGKPGVADCVEMFCAVRNQKPCKTFIEHGIRRNQRLETYEEAIKREEKLLNFITTQKLQIND